MTSSEQSAFNALFRSADSVNGASHNGTHRAYFRAGREVSCVLWRCLSRPEDERSRLMSHITDLFRYGGGHMTMGLFDVKSSTSISKKKVAGMFSDLCFSSFAGDCPTAYELRNTVQFTRMSSVYQQARKGWVAVIYADGFDPAYPNGGRPGSSQAAIAAERLDLTSVNLPIYDGETITGHCSFAVRFPCAKPVHVTLCALSNLQGVLSQSELERLSKKGAVIDIAHYHVWLRVGEFYAVEP